MTYTVTVKADDKRGDNLLSNVIVKTGTDECVPAPGASCETEHPVPLITDTKSVDPASGTPVVAGQELTYTLTFINSGEAAGTVDKVDDLTHVTDDADVISEPVASDNALTVNRDGNRISITGSLAAGQTVTVSYTVKVKPTAQRGDDVLANFLIQPDEQPPTEPVCEPKEGEAPDCTTNPVGDIVPSKTVDPKSGSTVEAGDDLTYTLSFQNTGKGAALVDYTDHMAGILDDATLTGDIVASDGLTVTRDGNTLHITGTIRLGQTGTVTYTVNVKAYDRQGDHHLGNFLTITGEQPPAQCVDTNPLCTENPIDPPKPGGNLPMTGGTISVAVILAALLLLGVGSGLVFAGRRRKAAAVGDGTAKEIDFDDLL